MSNIQERKIEVSTRSKRVQGEKRKYKAKDSFVFRPTERIADVLEEVKNNTSLSKNSIISLCVITQLNEIVKNKVEKIEVFYKEDGIMKKEVYCGNTLNKVSNFDKKVN